MLLASSPGSHIMEEREGGVAKYMYAGTTKESLIHKFVWAGIIMFLLIILSANVNMAIYD